MGCGSEKKAIVTERVTTPRSYVVVTQDSNPNSKKSSTPSLPATGHSTGQQEPPQKQETTPSSLPSQQCGSPDSKPPTDDVKTTRSRRVV